MRLNGITAGFVCSAFVSLAVSAFAAEPAWELAPPDAKILVGIDIQALKNAPVTEAFKADAKSTFKSQVENIAPMGPFPVPKFELLEDIDSIFLASNAEKVAPRPVNDKVETTATTAPAANTNPSFLLALSGTFPDGDIRPLLRGPHPSYKGINVYRGTGANPMAVAVLDEHLVLLGDEKSIYRAIDRKTMGLKAQGPLFARARELAASNDAWVVVRDIASEIKNAGGPGAAFASEVEGFDFGLAAQKAFSLNIALATKTEAAAQMFAQLLTSQIQVGLASKLDDQAAAEALSRIKVTATGKSMQVQIAMTNEELLENIRKAREQQANGGTRLARRPIPFGNSTAANAPISAPIAPAEPPAPQPRKIKIYGLDDGPKEIQLDKAN